MNKFNFEHSRYLTIRLLSKQKRRESKHANNANLFNGLESVILALLSVGYLRAYHSRGQIQKAPNIAVRRTYVVGIGFSRRRRVASEHALQVKSHPDSQAILAGNRMSR